MVSDGLPTKASVKTGVYANVNAGGGDANAAVWLGDSAEACVFLGGAQAQGEGVEAGFELLLQQGVDGAGAFHAGLAGEGSGDEEDGVVRLAARAGAGVAGVAVAFVLHVQDGGGVGLPQQGFDAVRAGIHGRIMPHVAVCAQPPFPKSPRGST